MPSAEAMVTVGRVAMVDEVVDFRELSMLFFVAVDFDQPRQP